MAAKAKKNSHLQAVEPTSLVVLPPLGQYASRKAVCPVRTIFHGTQIREKMYQIPLVDIERVSKDQMRLQDSQDTAVSEKQDDMEQNGQENGIGLKWNPATGKFRVIWGHTRYRGARKTAAEGGTIPNVKDGHIWGYVLDDSSAVIEQLKGIENTNFPHAVSATPEDVAHSLKQMVRTGVFGSPSDFEELEQTDQRKRLKAWVDQYAKTYGGRKFTKIWNIVKRDIKEVRKKLKTWDKSTSLVDWFNKFNPWGLINPLTPGKEVSGTVIDLPNGKKLAVYFVTAFKEFHTNVPANTQWKRNVNKEADEVVVVACFNESPVSKLPAKRTEGVDKLRKWNGGLSTNSVDRLLMVPATELEEQHEIQTPWVVDVTF